MKPILLGAVLALLVLLAPRLVAAALGLAGAACVWAATQPPVLTFVLGALAGPRLTHRLRSTR